MTLELALGPLLFNWSAEDVAGFYDRMAGESLVRRVYLGEVVCGKREPLNADVLARAADRLRAAGKEVVWSTLALLATARDRSRMRRLLEDAALVEVNDVSALPVLPVGQPFTAGPLLNVYNATAAQILIDRGCDRLCANVELPLRAIAEIHRACPTLPIELFAFGRMPLALSARCHHAHRFGLSKDTCRFVCDRDPDGQAVQTVEGAPFLSINGVQTLSHGVQCVGLSPETLWTAGVRALRLSPHACDMSAVIAAYGRFIDSGDVERLHAQLRASDLPAPLVAGYLEGEPGMRPVPG
ncbi:U32 family peptidase [Phenylobacterium sp.]|uniref:ubiquinone anaerobic biosynthesis protein UbiV n=1 Tax=Phenylobacterium sp. TaxID=1871053 RepID=UPI001842B51A|nr:U32 family peptidase [Phenylobacterium sp.]MBA4794814.1 U32 family peptidase [Phenylobacterium sp.]MBC7166749.1 U32 family peptidase [Phenylobacterium sp.]